ncbi:hypothetical protein M0R45_026100 [Rubus argutus]|uniref:Uncharacterized protein n=1 Tax=Rubus argutus TaxID=59490 RepID=A0AAW1WW24_RUBAR
MLSAHRTITGSSSPAISAVRSNLTAPKLHRRFDLLSPAHCRALCPLSPSYLPSRAQSTSSNLQPPSSPRSLKPSHRHKFSHGLTLSSLCV